MSFKYVTVFYGPCDSFHTVDHKPQKLRGLRDRLQKLGYRVDYVPVRFVNYCMLEMCGHEVFRCNIQNLRFNLPYELDPVCQRAVDAVVESTAKLCRARLYLWFDALIEDQLFSRNEWAPNDYWPKEEEELEPYANVMDCIKCCDILVHKVSKESIESKEK